MLSLLVPSHLTVVISHNYLFPSTRLMLTKAPAYFADGNSTHCHLMRDVLNQLQSASNALQTCLFDRR